MEKQLEAAVYLWADLFPFCLDAESPVIDRCRSPPPILTHEETYPATWDEPQFSDNSGNVMADLRC